MPQPSIGRQQRARFYQDFERRAIAWTARTLKYFDPDGVGPSERTFARKALAELALLLVYRVRLDPAPLEADYLALLAHVESVFARRSYRDAIARDHRSFLLYAYAYAALKVCGRATPDDQRLVAQALDSRLPLVVERIPYRQLDLLHFLYLTGNERGGPGCADLFPLTLLAGDPNVVELKDDDAYAITHALFYMTDFGLRPAEWGCPFDVPAAAELVETLMRRYRAQENADLTAELLASSICLGVRTSTEMNDVWEFLCGAQEADGRVAGPRGFVDEAKAEELGGPAYREWITSYHTTMVAALAALMARRAATDPDYPISQRIAEPGRKLLMADLRGRCQRAVDEAGRWLGEQLGHEDLTHAVRAAAGLALCSEGDDRTPGLHGELASLVARIDEVLEEEFPFDALGADTLLLAARCFLRADLTSRTLTDELNALARSVPLSDLHECPEAYAACRLLVDLGKLDRHALAEVAANLPVVEPNLLPDETAAAFSTRVLQATGSVRSRLDGRAMGPHTAARLTAELIRACQDYRLGDATLMIRVLVFLGWGARRIVRDAVACLLSQQRSDGSFGYFADDVERGEQAAARLAWTAGAVWALVDYAGTDATPGQC